MRMGFGCQFDQSVPCSGGGTPQKPVKHAYEQRPAAVQNWLNEEYVAMAQRAKQEQAEIHCGDETGIRSDWQHGRSYAPKGKTPVYLPLGETNLGQHALHGHQPRESSLHD